MVFFPQWEGRAGTVPNTGKLIIEDKRESFCESCPYFRTLGVEAEMSEVDTATWNSSPNGVFKKEVGRGVGK